MGGAYTVCQRVYHAAYPGGVGGDGWEGPTPYDNVFIMQLTLVVWGVMGGIGPTPYDNVFIMQLTLVVWGVTGGRGLHRMSTCLSYSLPWWCGG